MRLEKGSAKPAGEVEGKKAPSATIRGSAGEKRQSSLNKCTPDDDCDDDDDDE